MGITIGIDASRNRSGGAKAHLVGILSEADPNAHNIDKVHVWCYKKLAKSLPRHPWLVTHSPEVLERSIIHQLWWQFWNLSTEVRNQKCDILLNTDAGTVNFFSPCVVMSRDMLSFEGGENNRFGLTKARLRLFLLRYVQIASLKRASGAIFLTNYASNVIQKYTGKLKQVAIVPHGVGQNFIQDTNGGNWDLGQQNIRCLYVSNASMYKHQWHVIRAITLLRNEGYKLELLLAGAGEGIAKDRVSEEIKLSDPMNEFVTVTSIVNHENVPELLRSSNLFIFASSCENMPNTLVEAMASGLPIACSDRGPMPEVLSDAGTYFNPESPQSIAVAVKEILDNRDLRLKKAALAKQFAEQFSWRRCADETMEYLNTVYRNSLKNK